MDIDFFNCGTKRRTKADVCLFDPFQNDILLLVQEDKRASLWDPSSAQARLVIKAVAVFNKNNASREVAGLPPLAERVMPGIVMVGTTPSFFKIPVTQALSSHIASGTYPPEETNVTFCCPPLPDHGDGMKPLGNRHEILRFFEAFKPIVWADI
ncbi:hypothetical protein BC826DRAFT_993782 [Russula brevipes]|nr:hypothetical protein BC826DRAFT_993782 [Russula brevipes]